MIWVLLLTHKFSDDYLLLDGVAIVHFLKSKVSVTFECFYFVSFFGIIVQYRTRQILEVVTCREQESCLQLKCSLRSFPAEARLPAEDPVVLES